MRSRGIGAELAELRRTVQRSTATRATPPPDSDTTEALVRARNGVTASFLLLWLVVGGAHAHRAQAAALTRLEARVTRLASRLDNAAERWAARGRQDNEHGRQGADEALARRVRELAFQQRNATAYTHRVLRTLAVAVQRQSGQSDTASLALPAEPFASARPAAVREAARATVVLTVECHAFHDWQSVVAVHSLDELRRRWPRAQNFDILRVVTCARNETRAMQRLAPWLRAEPISPHPTNKMEFPTLNKPHGLLAFVESARGRALPDEHEIILADPDFLFVKPLPLLQSRLGRPMASRYALGSHWLQNERIRSICGAACEGLGNLSHSDMLREWSGGPPIFIRMADLRRVVPHWFRVTEQLVLMGTPGNFESVPGGWLADMFAYIIGTYREQLPHTLRPFMVSYVSDEAEFNQDAHNTEPCVIHYCQGYNLSTLDGPYRGYFHKHEWHERDNKRHILSCSADDQHNVFRKNGWNPPLELLSSDIEPPLVRNLPSWEPYDRKHAVDSRLIWMFWQIKRGVEQAAADFRERFCTANGTLIDFDDHHHESDEDSKENR